jgi:hypothetical protein
MAMEALEQRPLIYDAAEVGRAGVFVTLDRDGSLAVYRGYVRPEDEPREETAVQDGDDRMPWGRGVMSVFRWISFGDLRLRRHRHHFGWSADQCAVCPTMRMTAR